MIDLRYITPKVSPSSGQRAIIFERIAKWHVYADLTTRMFGTVEYKPHPVDFIYKTGIPDTLAARLCLYFKHGLVLIGIDEDGWFIVTNMERIECGRPSALEDLVELYESV